MPHVRRRLSITTCLIFVLLAKAPSAIAASGYRCIVVNAYELSRGGIRLHMLRSCTANGSLLWTE